MNDFDPQEFARLQQEYLAKELNKLAALDSHKPVFVPLIIAEFIVNSLTSLDGKILVHADTNVLIAVLRRLRSEGRPRTEVHFHAHTQAQVDFNEAAFGQEFMVQTTLISYNKPIDEMKRELKKMDFDIILGNPPYSIAPKGKQLNKDPIYQTFFNICFGHLKEGGHIGWIQPTAWRTDYERRADFKEMRHNVGASHLEKAWLSLTPWKSGEGSGQAAVVVDILIVGKSKPGTTIVVVNDEEIIVDQPTIQKLNSMVGGSSESEALKAKLMSFTNDFIINKTTYPPTAGSDPIARNVRDDVYQYAVNCANRFSSGKSLAWARIPQMAQTTEKVIVSLMRAMNPTYDPGNVGIGADSAAYPVSSKEEAEFVTKLLNSDPIQYLIAVHGDVQYSRTSKNAGKRNRGARFLNQIDIDFSRWDKSDVEFKKYFHYLDDKDWAEIESVLK